MKLHVIDETKDVYKCPYCDKKYDTYNEALDCANDCAEVDMPIDESINIFRCPYCNKTYEEVNKAEECLQRHEECQDEFYTVLSLKIAASHPYQTKLIINEENA